MSDRRMNGAMVKLARDLRNLTQGELADRAGLGQATISRVEMNQLDANDLTVAKIAKATEFPPEFFFQPEPYNGLGLSTIFYRKRSSALQGHMRRLQAEVNIRRMTVKELIRDVEIKTTNEILFYDIDTAHPRDVAVRVRANWKLPEGPIRNLTAAIEGAGGIVFRFPFGTTDIDAISQWPDDCPPLFFVNSDATADRIRFSLAHELGHMTLHHSASDSMETEANQFANEFLMPAAEIRAQLLGLNDLVRLAVLKPYWQVSMAALLYRATELECVSKSKASSLWMRYNQNGYRKSEPNPLPHESPTFLAALLDAHERSSGSSIADLARRVHLSEADFRLRYKPAVGLRIAG